MYILRPLQSLDICAGHFSSRWHVQPLMSPRTETLTAPMGLQNVLFLADASVGAKRSIKIRKLV
eukprot:4084458-Lingulodinium_polyedra.AAC.1